ncbi:hypothetical protein [Phenylobacterium sp. Root700]|uniref:hypothetical protein n=1 Tax=Phenylobacterium sp. Root700 TaxID=1736591 RepID=UPI0006F7985A|nr:hypothetical protein [Phenylobacterium sp. Root700]KRB46542.1 hypothetical protein ASE02_18860 [Phenylobacterium sp. Root700]
MRGSALLALIPLLALAACAPEPPPARPRLALDCSLPYETLAAKVLAQPGLKPAPQERGEPYRFYNVEGGGEAFVLTQAGAPGHPAILKQEAVQENGRKVMQNTGCPYGDKAGFDQVMAYLQSLSAR